MSKLIGYVATLGFFAILAGIFAPSVKPQPQSPAKAAPKREVGWVVSCTATVDTLPRYGKMIVNKTDGRIYWFADPNADVKKFWQGEWPWATCSVFIP